MEMPAPNPNSAPTAPRAARVASVLWSLARDGGTLVYNAVSLLGAPFLLYRKWRLLHFIKLDCEFDRARWTLRFPSAPQPSVPEPSGAKSGPRVVFITLGWGEVATMEPLARALRAARPDARLIFTVKHREAIPLASQLADETVLPLPFDRPLPVARWHARARPDVVIFYERFNLALLLRSLWLRRVPFVIVHARMNARRANARSSPNLKFKSWQLRGLNDILLATPDYVPGTGQIAPATAQMHVVGSIKFPHQKPHIAPARQAQLRAWIEAGTNGAPLLAAGSTHETEEAFVLDALEIVRGNLKSRAPVLLLAPRKPYRTDEVLRLLEARGARVSRRSQWTPGAPARPVDVLLLDTLGELMIAYQWSVGAFVGGTIFGSSHNVAEPLIWSIPVAYGPNRGNFGVEQNLCEQAGVGFRVRSPNELAAHWTTLLQSPQLRDDLARRVDELVALQHDAFARTLEVLVRAVDAATPSR